MAATYDITQGSYNPPNALDAGRMVYAVQRVVDFANDKTLTALNSGAGPGQNDVLELVKIPAYSIVYAVAYKVEVASSNLADADIGDGNNVDGWHDGLTMAVAGVEDYSGIGLGNGGTEAYAALPKAFTAEETIDLKIITAASITTGRLLVTVFMGPMNP